MEVALMIPCYIDVFYPKLGLRLSTCLSVLEWAVNRWQTADAMKKRVLQKTTALAFLDLSSTLLHLLAVALITFEISLRRERILEKKRALSGIRDLVEFLH